MLIENGEQNMSQLHPPYGNTGFQTSVLCQWIEEGGVHFGGAWGETEKRQNAEIHNTFAKTSFFTAPV